MTQFAGAAEGYDRYMGRYTPGLAVALADAAGLLPGMRALDVGCGPGGLTRELVSRLGPDRVAAIDPAPQFVAACGDRNPGVDVRVGVAEQLPWEDDAFDAALSSLVIGFLTDPERGVGEMARVTRPGGVVGGCVWDIATGGMTMLQIFWDGVRTVRPDSGGEHAMVGTSQGEIARLLTRTGLVDVVDGALTTTADYDDFDDFWTPFTLGFGPAGQYLVGLAEDEREHVRQACRAAVPEGRFRLEARAWYALARVPEVSGGRR